MNPNYHIYFIQWLSFTVFKYLFGSIVHTVTIYVEIIIVVATNRSSMNCWHTNLLIIIIFTFFLTYIYNNMGDQISRNNVWGISSSCLQSQCTLVYAIWQIFPARCSGDLQKLYYVNMGIKYGTLNCLKKYAKFTLPQSTYLIYST